MFNLKPLALAALTALAASASTLPRQLSGCSPSFQGHPVSIIYPGASGIEALYPASDTLNANIVTAPLVGRTPQFLVENSGHVPTSYLIKDAADHGLVAYATAVPRADAAVKLNAIDNSGADPRQYWVLTCAACASTSTEVPPGGVFGTSCQIANVAVGRCVQRVGAVGTPPVLAPCSATEGAQMFNFLRENL
ncbi:hypothetical protein B0H15DRAFT_174295 [Mycena belliarum]|uniref:Uncharacterized protein n=1 Tax=Mycena belliarum TaxID=1033014 RepID=A0AAD6U6A7_9AGAR|nr:hypothetical protein B0H15DRAFT_174295 [Mycena belliae]